MKPKKCIVCTRTISFILFKCYYNKMEEKEEE